MSEERWPFLTDDGQVIHRDKFYGFADAGGVTPEFGSVEEVRQYIIKEYAPDNEAEYMSTNPEDLGGAAFCILSGAQFVEQLKTIGELSDFGKWSD